MRLFLLLVFLFLKLSVYGNSQLPFKEKVFIHTSTDTLNRGETLWFQGYLVSTLTTENSDKVLYVDIVSLKSNAIIKRKVLYMKNGTANGEFFFGKELPSGNYLLRGYTQWIASYATNTAFEKVICLLTKDGDLIENAILDEDIKLTKPTSFTLKFYPEGTTWLAKQQTRFAVKIKASSGKSPAQSITIFNKTGKWIGGFSTDSLGFGTFILNSADEGSYAVLKQDIQQKKYFLPRFSDTGVAMKMNFDQDSLKISILQTNKDTLGKKPFLLVGKKSGEFFRRDVVPFGKELTLMKIPNRFLPEGLISFELYQGSKLITERLMFLPSLKEDEISIKEENKSDSTFVTIKSSPYAQLSLSAILGEAKVFPDKLVHISSELKNPALLQDYLKGKEPDINQLLLMFSVKDLKDIVLNEKALLDYSPEKGMRISGKVVDRKRSLAGVNISLNLKSDKKSLLLASKTDSLGRFFFDNLVFYGKAQMKLIAMNASAEKVGTILLDTTFTTLEVPVLPFDTLNKYSTTNLLNRDSLRVETEVKIKGHLLNEVVVKTDRLNFLLNGSFKALHKDQVFNLGKEDLEYQTLTSWMLKHVKGATNPYGSGNSGEEGGIAFRGNDTIKVVGSDNLYTSVSRAIYPQFVVNGREYFYDDKDLAKAVHQQFSDLQLDKVKSVRVHRLTGFYAGIGVLVDKYIIYLTIDDTYKEKGVLTAKVNGFDESTPYLEDEKFSIEEKPSLIFWKPNIMTNQDGEAIIGFKRSSNMERVIYHIEGKTANGKFLSLNTILKP